MCFLFGSLTTAQHLKTSVHKTKKSPHSYRLMPGFTYCRRIVGVRGSLERDISSLRAFGPGGGQISRVVHVSTRAAFGVLRENIFFLGGDGYVNPGLSR